MNVSRILFAVRWPRTPWAIGLALPLVALAAPAAGAGPKVEWVPGTQHQARAFEISTSRVHLVDSFELRGGFDTRAEAEAEVKRLLAIDAACRAKGPSIMSGWDFAVIRVEERRAAMKGQTELDLAIAAINRLYARVKRIRDVELRYFAAGLRFSTPDTRAETNRTITYFNQELRLVRERFGEAFEARTGRMMVELPLIGEPGKKPPERKSEPGPEFFAMQQGGFTPSEQWYTVGAQEMIVQFFMQPYVISDSFEVLGDTGGGGLRHFVRRDQISTTTPNPDVPLRQQQVVRDTFTKPAGVTRILVRVTPNPTSNSTKWWYLARTDGKNYWEK